MFDPQKQPFIVLLDGIQDPRNIGAILRSVYCAGADGAIICKKNNAPLNATAFKASAGLAEHLAIMNAPSVEAAVLDIEKAGYQMYVSMFDGKNALKINYTQPLCVVIGGEGFGVSKIMHNKGTKITIPQRTPDISYNASVAAGIILATVGVQMGKI